jgi:hypothetical protein
MAAMNIDLVEAVVSAAMGTLSRDGFLDMHDLVTMLTTDSIPLDKLPTGPKENVYFIVDNHDNLLRRRQGKKCTFADDCGPWNHKTAKNVIEFFVRAPGGRLVKVTHKNKQYCLHHKVNGKFLHVPLEPQPDPSTVLRVHLSYSKHVTGPGYCKRVIWLEQQGIELPSNAMYEYKGRFPGWDLIQLAQKERGKKKGDKNIVRAQVYFFYSFYNFYNTFGHTFFYSKILLSLTACFFTFLLQVLYYHL